MNNRDEKTGPQAQPANSPINDAKESDNTKSYIFMAEQHYPSSLGTIVLYYFSSLLTQAKAREWQETEWKRFPSHANTTNITVEKVYLESSEYNLAGKEGNDTVRNKFLRRNQERRNYLQTLIPAKRDAVYIAQAKRTGHKLFSSLPDELLAKIASYSSGNPQAEDEAFKNVTKITTPSPAG